MSLKKRELWPATRITAKKKKGQSAAGLDRRGVAPLPDVAHARAGGDPELIERDPDIGRRRVTKKKNQKKTKKNNNKNWRTDDWACYWAQR